MSSSLLQVLRQWIPCGEPVDAAHCTTDRQLLLQFHKDRAEHAFSQLIQRHGTMVLGVCRRLLRNEQDVEDAFQAVFLVLARRAGDVRWQDSIGGWLHETAVRVATHARARDLKRREHESRALDMRSVNETTPQYERAELREIFDDEIQQMAPKYRQPLVLCYLEGKSHVEAAAELGWPVGSVKGRLARAREELRQRLVRRGVTVTAAAFATLLLQDAASASVPYPLAAATTRGAMSLIGPGASTISPGTISPGVFELVDAVIGRPAFRSWIPGAVAGGVTAACALALFFLWPALFAPRNGSQGSSSESQQRPAAAQNLDPNAAFAGKWRVVSWVEAGKYRDLPDDAIAGVNYNRLQIVADKTHVEFEISLDPRQSPMTIDLKTEAAGISFTQLGIYAHQGDRLHIAWSPHGATRPDSFDSTDENGQTVVQLQRASPNDGRE